MDVMAGAQLGCFGDWRGRNVGSLIDAMRMLSTEPDFFNRREGRMNSDLDLTWPMGDRDHRDLRRIAATLQALLAVLAIASGHGMLAIAAALGFD